MDTFSKNDRAGELMGFRQTEGVVFIDEPCELGFRCPVCLVEPEQADGNYDDRLRWSEYNGFLWCSVCNKDYPSSFCVPLDGEDEVRPGVRRGVDAAIGMFLNQIRDAQLRATLEATTDGEHDEAFGEALVEDLFS